MKQIIAFAAAMLLLFSVLSLSFAAEASGGDVSPAIDVLRRQTSIKKSVMNGEEASFGRAEYEKAVGTGIQYITVTSLPESGSLKLNGIQVAVGQTVAASSLENLELVKAENAVSASFTFRVSASGWEMTDIKCTVDFSDSRNMPPVVKNCSVESRKNVTQIIPIDVFEPDGDSVVLVFDEYPVSGSAVIDGRRIVYTPCENFVGSDSFVLHASDEYGNESEKAAFDVTVENSDLVFCDMSSSASHSDAITLAEKNVVTYVRRDGQYYFEPEKKVSRIDFLIMLMTGCDMTPSGDDVSVFADAESITFAKRTYLAEAESIGIIKESEFFRPEDVITRLDAAVWVSAIVGRCENLSTLSDISSLSSDEAVAVSSVVQKGIFESVDGCFYPDDTLDREETARIICRVMEYIKNG